MIIKQWANTNCGIHIWNPDLEFVSFFIAYQKQDYAMTTSFATQHQLHQQKLNSTIKYHNSNLEENESVPKKDKQKKGKKKRILIVDDDLDITYTLRKILEANGFSAVDEFNEPLLALQNFKSDDYSLLITDIAMPIMNGFELYENLKKIDNEIKVIFMTASNINFNSLSELLHIDPFETSYEKKEMTILRGCEERLIIITKPVEIMKFIETVNNQL